MTFGVDPVDLERVYEDTARYGVDPVDLERVYEGPPIPLEALPRPRRVIAFVLAGGVTSLRPSAFTALARRATSDG